ncbi:MAG: hypothetical protein PHG63_01245 [Candidatus Dojkabacteria bacterium]|nr:hypothetical protein [Candidatus Dojkabacteria bacterium]
MESKNVSRETSALQDLTANISDIIGPVLAGFLSDTAGSSRALAFLGLGSALIVTMLWKLTPAHINIRINTRELAHTTP